MVIIARCPVFDDYLNKANELHQKLLIEIKTSRKDSPDMMKRFMENMERFLSRIGHQCNPWIIM